MQQLDARGAVQILRDIQRECDQHAKELRKAWKDETNRKDTRVCRCFDMSSEQSHVIVALREPITAGPGAYTGHTARSGREGKGD